ncbi:MAG: glycosyl transferase, partial [Ignavibacteria bacterium]|nr:glycosyl transferase [Ignavibacteria bacterium]
MYNFCTLFDTHYISRGLTLYYSLEKVCEDFHIYIFAFNDKCYSILKKLNLKRTTIITLKEFEDEELLKIKPTRSIGEYCWTSTSSTILYVLEKYNVESCTYLDADLFFYSSPKPIFDELGDNSILLTEHRYSPE